MTTIQQWLDEVRQGQMSIAQLVENMNQRGALPPEEYQRELSELDAMLEAKSLDPRLHRAVTKKLQDLQGDQPSSGADAADDKTVMAKPPTADDETVMASNVGPDDEATVMASSEPEAEGEDDATQMLMPGDLEADEGDEDIPPTQMLMPGQLDDPSAPLSGPDSTTGSRTGNTGTTGTTGSTSGSSARTWRRLAEQEGPTETVDVGSRLKDRFVLEKKIGTGGMGVVYLALDERKVEARDRNPRVAVKVLNDEFRRHPDSLIALQRESRRSQQLAHDNIVRVYDFDKDGSIVFMTMEFVDGEDLKDMIRSLGGKRMSVEEAFPIIEGMGRALARAHRDGVVHSDFKPGNVMLTSERVPKVFDFGIARAGKQRSDASGEQTVFDAGTLGALTPAYASLEMLQGKDAEPADDLYALAIVTYELLGGRHPFNKTNAEQSQQQGLTPLRIPGLSTLQWKTLQKGLAFSRQDRIGSAEEFINGLRPRTAREKALPIAVGSALGLVGLVLAAWLGSNYLYARKVQNVEDCIGAEACADAAVLAQQLTTLKPTDQNLIAEQRRDEIKGIFYASMAREWAPDQGRYDFAGAKQVVDLAFGIYGADSAWVQELGEGLEADRNSRLSKLNDEFSVAIGQPAFAAEGDAGPGLLGILDAIRSIDPQQAMLKDGRIGPALEDGIRAGLKDATLTPQEQVELAEQRLSLARRYVEPESLRALEQDVTSRREQVDALEEEQRRLAEAAAQREKRLAALDGALRQAQNTAEWRAQARQAWLEARESVTGDSGSLSPYAKRLSATLLSQSQESQKSDDLESASEAARLGVELLPKDRALDRQFTKVTKERDRRIAQAETEAERTRLGLQRLDQLLTRPAPTTAWIGEVSKSFSSLEGKVDDGELSPRRQKLSQTLASLVDRSLAEKKFDLAEALADRGARIDAGDTGLAALPDTVAQARRQAQAEQIERLQELAANPSFSSRWQQSVTSTNDALKGVRDPGLEAAREKLATAFAERARSLAEDKSFDAARKMVDAGASLAPRSAAVVAARDRVDSLEQADRAAAEAKRIGFKVEELERTIAIKAAAAEIGPAVSALRELKKLDKDNAYAKSEAPKQIAEGALKLSKRFAGRGDYKNAIAAADRGLEVLQTSALSQARSGYQVDWCRTDMESGRASAARRTECLALFQARDKRLYAKYQSSGQAAKPTPKPAPPKPTPPPAPPKPATPPPVATVKPFTPGKDPCSSRYSGRGSRSKYQCFDKTANGRGPTLVVIAGFGTFAITQSEISKYDFARYCRSTQQCQAPSGDPYLPVTNVSGAQAKGFARWLSTVSGRTYRLPTEQEWRHAATVGGRDVFADGHCGSPGAGPRQTTAGVMNKWGVVNAVGNVWELVTNQGTVMMVGGSYMEPKGQCNANARRGFGGANASVGFRLLRELK